ncbi:glycoside hydrolase family 5 protein [Parablautia intestinalis]|uniref:glycoside hydrolase family 5 protein n=1 Tax=Parablautia intestinalis TaxID=2320100 RepID=UPI00256ED2EA|nr:cellulase family glycosylhydrolase [Parablautia intestinalis]
MNTYFFDKARVKGFLHARGKIMVNGDEEEIILRGLGAGNWNNPEGFMIGVPVKPHMSASKENVVNPRLDRGRNFSALIRELCGTKYEREFWPKWFDNHLGEADIRQIAQWGYNSVRLPIDAMFFLYEEPGITFNEASFAMLDRVLKWCEKYRIYGIIDLHGAVGGQTAMACDNGVDSMPHLFFDEESRERTLCLCEELAKRYKDNPFMGGYDMINEPLSRVVWEEYLPKLKFFYKEMIERMRKYDRNHIIFLNGHEKSERVDIFDEDFDPQCHNWGIAFHNYGAIPQKQFFVPYLEKQAQLEVPLWFSEGGGNDLWMSAIYEISVEYHIGFNTWCYKMAATDDAKVFSPYVKHRLPGEWQMILDYAFKGSRRPSYTHAQAIFDEYLNNLKFENCEVYDIGANSALRRPGGTIPAVAYDRKHEDGEKAFAGSYFYGNAFNYRIDDGMHIVTEPGFVSRYGALNSIRGEWQHYELKLYPKDYAEYTLRNVSENSYIDVVCRSNSLSSLFITENMRDENKVLYNGSLNSADENEYGVLHLSLEREADTAAIRITCTQGEVFLKKIIYR